MRKRITIVVVAALVIGVLAYVASLPKRGSVEWHKQRCLHLHADVWGKTIRWKIAGWCDKYTGVELVKIRDGQFEELQREIEGSLKHLVAAGFLIRREYVFTNAPRHNATSEILGPERDKWLKSTPFERTVFTWTESEIKASPSGRCTAMVWIIAPREDLARWDQILGPTNLQTREISNWEYRARY